MVELALLAFLLQGELSAYPAVDLFAVLRVVHARVIEASIVLVGEADDTYQHLVILVEPAGTAHLADLLEEHRTGYPSLRLVAQCTDTKPLNCPLESLLGT